MIVLLVVVDWALGGLAAWLIFFGGLSSEDFRFLQLPVPVAAAGLLFTWPYWLLRELLQWIWPHVFLPSIKKDLVQVAGFKRKLKLLDETAAAMHAAVSVKARRASVTVTVSDNLRERLVRDQKNLVKLIHRGVRRRLERKGKQQ